MIRKNNDGFDSEGIIVARLPKGLTQKRDVIGQRCRSAVSQRHGEKENTTGNPIAPKSHHR
jgi:hypothetical protein